MPNFKTNRTILKKVKCKQKSKLIVMSIVREVF